MDNEVALRVHHIVPRSRANGPGVRWVVWTQGCTLRCPGCFNPDTHALDGGTMIPVPTLLHQIATTHAIDGVSVSGGEPLQQWPALLALLTGVRMMGLSAIVWTGYAWPVVQRMAWWPVLATVIDVLIAGPYRADHHLGHGLRGSANKTIVTLSDRYTVADLLATPDGEVIIEPDGTLTVTGIAGSAPVVSHFRTKD